MIKSVTINDALLVYQVVKELYNQNIKFSIGVSFKIFKLYQELDEMNSYIIQQLKLMVPGLSDSEHTITDDERKVYESILLTKIDIDNYGLTEEELTKYQDINISIKSIGILLRVL